VPSEKRQRQRSNREQKRAEEAKRRRRAEIMAIVRRYTIYALVFGGALVALTLLFGR